MTTFAIIGFGEVGGILARDLHAGGAALVLAFDTAPAARSRAEAADHVAACTSAGAATRGADVVIVAVTAGAVPDAMASLARDLAHGPLVVDVNSVSPGTKRRAAAVVAAAGGRYVEAAVMASVPPLGLRTPMLLGGPHARDFVDLMRPFDLDLRVMGEEVGLASTVKMSRSVVIKGLEALVTESLLTARRHGVEDLVLASLAETLPRMDWPAFARCLLSRSLVHGRRRAEEMEEVALTVAEAGTDPLLSKAIAERQRLTGQIGTALPSGLLEAATLGALLDAVAAAGAAVPDDVPTHVVTDPHPDRPERRDANSSLVGPPSQGYVLAT